jgi:hypothetical protein
MTSSYILLTRWLCFKKQYTKMSFWFNFGYIIVISPFRGKISTNDLLSAWHIHWVHEKSVLLFISSGLVQNLALRLGVSPTTTGVYSSKFAMCQVTSNNRGSFFKFLLCRAVFLLVLYRFDSFLKTCRS